MFNFSKKIFLISRYYFLFLLIIVGSLSFGQKINYSAGKISSNLEENLVLENSVSIQIDNLSITTEKFVLDQQNQKGYSESLSFLVEENNFWGEAERLNFSNENVTFNDVSFSLCPCFEKIWWVEASEISFSEDSESVNFKNAKLKVLGKTIGAWPKGSFPASSERRSGFLLPEINISNKSGIDASIPYYLNLKKNLDATLEPRYISKRGFGISNEFRYLTNTFNGVINSSILTNDEEYKDNYNKNSFRWSFNLIHSQTFNKNSFLEIKYANVSDTFFLNDFGGDFNGTSKTLYAPQQFIISNFSNKHKAVLKVNAFKIVNPLGVNQFQELPKLELSWFEKNKFFNYGINSYLSFYRKGGAFNDNEKEKLDSYHISPYLNYSTYRNSILTEVSAKINLSKFNLETSSIERIQPELKLKFSKNFIKKNISNVSFLKPYLLFSFSPQKNQNDIPLINSGISMLQNSFLINNLIGKNFLPEKKDLILGWTNEIYDSKRKFLKFNFSKKISSTKGIRILDKTFILPEPYNLDLSYLPDKKSTLNLNLKINEERDFNTLSLNFEKNLSVSSFVLNYFWAENINSYLLNDSAKKKLNQLNAEFRFNGNYKYNFSSKIIYDIENSNLTNLVLGLEYENPGLKLGMALIHSKELDWIKVLNESIYDDYNQESFRIYFELKGLGSLGRPIDNYIKRRTLN